MRERACAVCVHEGKVLLVELEDPKTKTRYLFPPGGRIESGETALEAAVRETLEETGYSVVPIPHSEVVSRYPFEWDGTVHDCLTHFFRAKLLPVPRWEVNDRSYWRGIRWVEIPTLNETLSYNEPIRTAVLTLLSKPL